MPLSFAGCKIPRSALPSGSVLLSVRTVAAKDPRGFMWALWLAGKHTGSTLLGLRCRMPESLVPVSAHLGSANENSEVLWFLTEVFAEVVARGILGAHVM